MRAEWPNHNERLLYAFYCQKAAILLPLRDCGRLPKSVGGAPMAGVRKASREETAGRFAMALVQAYGDI